MGMPGAPKDVDVDVILISEKKGDFEIQPQPAGSLPKGTDGELIFENKGHSGFWIYFHLKDPNQLGYRFPEENKQLNEAVWSQFGDGACPSDGIWEVFTPRKVLDNGMTLKVRNPNQKPDIGKFGYTLRVTKDGGTSFLDLDPGGNNKNGPIEPFLSAVVATTVTGALVAIATIVLINNSLISPDPLIFAIGGAFIGLLVGAVIG